MHVIYWACLKRKIHNKAVNKWWQVTLEDYNQVALEYLSCKTMGISEGTETPKLTLTLLAELGTEWVISVGVNVLQGRVVQSRLKITQV